MSDSKEIKETAAAYLTVEASARRLFPNRNDRFDTTNVVLIHNAQRLYGRDQVCGTWHRHPAAQPAARDDSPEGCRTIIDLPEFLDEVESILAALGLP
jgi:hypothetical protein